MARPTITLQVEPPAGMDVLPFDDQALKARLEEVFRDALNAGWRIQAAISWQDEKEDAA